LYQSSSCRISGTERNTQVYPQLTACSSGECDSRMSASTVPSAKPISAVIRVSSMVVRTPCTIDVSVR
jgi:hypothetical protein